MAAMSSSSDTMSGGSGNTADDNKYDYPVKVMGSSQTTAKTQLIENRKAFAESDQVLCTSLDECMGTTSYYKGILDNLPKGVRQKPIKLGQRKLAMGEIKFLSSRGTITETTTVVYIGSATGTKMYYIATLFPRATFELYDPVKHIISKRYGKRGASQIKYFERPFTDDDARAYGRRIVDGERMLVISDIRYGAENENEFESNVSRDMIDQMRWCKIINPVSAMLKFRLPYNASSIDYFDGIPMLQPWARPGSGESRLFVDDFKSTRRWSLDEYEGKTNYWQNVMRVIGVFRTQGTGVGIIDECFDCALEYGIWEEYIEAGGTGDGGETASELMNKLETRISSCTLRGNTGRYTEST
jgi:hypothetical protein